MPSIAVGRILDIRIKHNDFFNLWVMWIDGMYMERSKIGRKIAVLARGQRLIFEE
jgi:hypothetical protein